MTFAALAESFLFYMDTGGPTMWVILFLSIAGVSIVVERGVFFLTAGRRAPRFSDSNLPPDATPDGETLQTLADRWIRAEIFEWDRDLALLEIIIRAAPMLGLLGTVLGMVTMFRVLSVGGAIDAAAVTGGIREALFTTVAGLCCAIPLLVLHGLLVSAVERREERLNRAADRWIAERLAAQAGGARDGARE